MARALTPASSICSLDSASGQHFQISTGEVIAARYKVRRVLGWGAFGKVVECIDLTDRSIKALKFIRAERRYVEEAKIEARILQKLKETASGPTARFVQIYDTFSFEDSYVIVFERLGRSLYSLLRKNQFKGLPIHVIAVIARQVLETLDYFHTRIQITHTDIKPENILLIRDNLTFDSSSNLHLPENVDIKIIDFGGATFAEEEHAELISTRPYRAPEVVLNLPWGHPADIWSVGCMLVELYTGQLLFPADDDHTLLAMIAKVRGRMPRGLIRASPRGEGMYDGRLRFKWPNTKQEEQGLLAVRDQPVLEDLIPNSLKAFRDLVYDLLEYDPSLRPTAAAALSHPFFKAVNAHARSRSVSSLIKTRRH